MFRVASWVGSNRSSIASAEGTHTMKIDVGFKLTLTARQSVTENFEPRPENRRLRIL
jgi:hypothetical protein